MQSISHPGYSQQQFREPSIYALQACQLLIWVGVLGLQQLYEKSKTGLCIFSHHNNAGRNKFTLMFIQGKEEPLKARVLATFMLPALFLWYLKYISLCISREDIPKTCCKYTKFFTKWRQSKRNLSAVLEKEEQQHYIYIYILSSLWSGQLRHISQFAFSACLS